MGKIIKIKNNDIENILLEVSRQYLVGNLKRPQKLDFIKDNNLEIGITNYSQYSTEVAHFHTEAVEYQYMLSGWTKYLDIETGIEYEFKKGDFFCIEKNTIYAQKSKPNTRILFIKSPSINDKNVVEVTDEILLWYKSKLKTVRKDYDNEESMPKANSLKPAVAVAILNESKKQILMLKRADSGNWTLPGGTVELNENLTDCAIREVKEETGLNIKILDIIGTYTNPNIRTKYSDGEVRREFTIVYYGVSTDNEVKIDEESTEYSWIKFEDIKNYSITTSQIRRIFDIIDFLKTGKKYMR